MLTPILQGIVQQASGLHLSGPTVAREARGRMDALGINGMGDYIECLRADPDEMTALIERLVVPETWLFRDPEAFAAAAEFARARHAAKGRCIRLLSLPCATGEEPYSLAMALLDAGMSRAQFTIDAIDISAEALARAKTAIYRQNAFRGENPGFRGRYFTASEQGEQLDKSVRTLVRFNQGNLLSMRPAPGQEYDAIFCRNLLIYFDEPTQHRAIAILENMLEDDGLLFAGYAELPVFATQGFMTAQLPRAFALRKKGRAPVTAGTERRASVRPQPAPVPAPASALASTSTSPRKTPPVGVSSASPAVRHDPARRPRANAVPATNAPLSADETTAAALLDEAAVLADRGQLDVAAARLDACLEKTPVSARAQAMLGAIHASRGDDVAAEQCLRRALYLDPTLYEVMCQLAILAEKQGNVAAAKAMRERAGRVRARQSGNDALPAPSRREAR